MHSNLTSQTPIQIVYCGFLAFCPKSGFLALIWNHFSRVTALTTFGMWGLNSFIHSDYFYIASSSPLLLRGAPDTSQILRRNFTPKRHRKLWAKDLAKVPTWRLKLESNPWPFGRRALTLPMRHTCPTTFISFHDLGFCVLSCMFNRRWLHVGRLIL